VEKAISWKNIDGIKRLLIEQSISSSHDDSLGARNVETVHCQSTRLLNLRRVCNGRPLGDEVRDLCNASAEPEAAAPRAAAR
jgi:hypothetical protein